MVGREGRVPILHPSQPRPGPPSRYDPLQPQNCPGPSNIMKCERPLLLFLCPLFDDLGQTLNF